MLVAIDDTDSTKGMCTTYLAAKLCQRLNVTETPRLDRLNPNIPYRTRGNGAIAFKAEGNNVEDTVLKHVKKYSMMEDKNTNPGVVLLNSDEIPTELNEFYRRAVSELVTIEEAEKTASSIGAAIHKFKNGRGVIGALAALGFTGEKTFELIAYRSPLNYGKRRRINSASVYRMNDRLYPRVFDNLDAEKKRVLITPRGYDPIFCGIRGLTAEDVSAAWDMIEPLETIECTQVFETNQATDAHLKPKKIAEIRPYDCVIVSGGVSSQPKSLAGGHMVFVLSDETGSIDCAAYKPTGSFRTVISQLAEGDSVVAYGGIGKYPHTVNLEKIEVRSLTEVYSTEHPICCGRRMTSAGKDKGVKCRVCGSKSTAKKQVVERAITPGFYDVPAGSRRHLSKPLYLNEVISTGKAHRI